MTEPGGGCTCTYSVVDYSDPERYHPENMDRELTPGCPVHDPTDRDALAAEICEAAQIGYPACDDCTDYAARMIASDWYATARTQALREYAETELRRLSTLSCCPVEHRYDATCIAARPDYLRLRAAVLRAAAASPSEDEPRVRTYGPDGEPHDTVLRTASGRIVTEEDIFVLAEEADRGYELGPDGQLHPIPADAPPEEHP